MMLTIGQGEDQPVVPHELTIAIVAKDAASTIERAARSALACSDYPVLLVDDHSGDETVDIAHDVLGSRLTVVPTAEARGVGNARQTALEHICTPFGMWLDADDELLPHRADAMLGALKAGADLVVDPVMLFESNSGKDAVLLNIPDFIRASGGIWRSFERNWIPMLAGGFRTGFALTVGMDRHFCAAEDYDFLLRALMAGAKMRMLEDCGYRYAHSPASLSRNLDVSIAFTEKALMKHALGDVSARLDASDMPSIARHYTLAAFALRQQDQQVFDAEVKALIQSDGLLPPYGRKGDWLAGFLNATAALHRDEPAVAAQHLEPLDDGQSADILNNLGAAKWQMGDTEGARETWHAALLLLPSYYDAKSNLEAASEGLRITRFPLRRAASRSRY
jgi:hypothetical protein